MHTYVSLYLYFFLPLIVQIFEPLKQQVRVNIKEQETNTNLVGIFRL